MTETAAERSSSPKAPDWGVHYGISHLWSEIAPGLWVGGTGDEDTIAHASAWREYRGERQPTDAEVQIGQAEFDAVVTMYAWARPVGWGVEEYRYGIYDAPSPDVFDQDKLRDVVTWAMRRWNAGERVLIRCQAGLNRSGLVAALVLVRSGLDPADAIATIRRGRSFKSLFNTAFEDFVLGCDVEFWRG